MMRGKKARKEVAETKLLIKRADRTKDHTLTRLYRLVLEALESEHTVLGLWFGDPETAKRAELCQCFWNVCMLGLVIECMLYNTAPSSASESSGAAISFNLVQMVIFASITAGLSLPALSLFKLIYTLGYARDTPVAQRVFKAIIDPSEGEDKMMVRHRDKKAPTPPPCARARCDDGLIDQVDLVLDKDHLQGAAALSHHLLLPAGQRVK